MREVSLFDELASPVWKLIYFDCGQPMPADLLRRMEALKARGVKVLILTASTKSDYPAGDLYYDIDELAHTVYGLLGPTTLLVRPDNYVAVRAAGKDFQAVETYFQQWFN